MVGHQEGLRQMGQTPRTPRPAKARRVQPAECQVKVSAGERAVLTQSNAANRAEFGGQFGDGGRF